ncbi:hypothetical protein BN2475_340148 [Paraburkholderia ribeironis]|uniref:Uncharacterized protein n=1 Tax=Paraburkholderia ribeironis TaxID=1247936 RepID=A0A1N7S4D5_9BURK|nr:hypothetical protein BN2475_340148 [Paraburkholderia ribeironis]
MEPLWDGEFRPTGVGAAAAVALGIFPGVILFFVGLIK